MRGVLRTNSRANLHRPPATRFIAVRVRGRGALCAQVDPLRAYRSQNATARSFSFVIVVTRAATIFSASLCGAVACLIGGEPQRIFAIAYAPQSMRQHGPAAVGRRTAMFSSGWSRLALSGLFIRVFAKSPSRSATPARLWRGRSAVWSATVGSKKFPWLAESSPRLGAYAFHELWGQAVGPTGSRFATQSRPAARDIRHFKRANCAVSSGAYMNFSPRRERHERSRHYYDGGKSAQRSSTLRVWCALISPIAALTGGTNAATPISISSPKSLASRMRLRVNVRNTRSSGMNGADGAARFSTMLPPVK